MIRFVFAKIFKIKIFYHLNSGINCVDTVLPFSDAEEYVFLASYVTQNVSTPISSYILLDYKLQILSYSSFNIFCKL